MSKGLRRSKLWLNRVLTPSVLEIYTNTRSWPFTPSLPVPLSSSSKYFRWHHCGSGVSEKGHFAVILQLILGTAVYLVCQTIRRGDNGFDSELSHNLWTGSKICEKIWIQCLHQSLDVFSIQQSFLTESSFTALPNSPAPSFVEPNPFMILFYKFPPLYRRLSPSVPWANFACLQVLFCLLHLSQSSGALVLPLLPYVSSYLILFPFYWLQKEEHKSKHATIMLAKYLYIALSCFCIMFFSP